MSRNGPPTPIPPMAFCGALALQAFLAGRKVRDPGDNRTNIYLLGLAPFRGGQGLDPASSTPRSCTHWACRPAWGDRLASGEGIQDALLSRPSMLFQTDEIDGLLQAINKSKEARHEALMTTLLSLYSSANSVFAMRPKAGKPDPRGDRPAEPRTLRHGDSQPLLRGPFRTDAHQRILRPADSRRSRKT